MKKWLWLFLPLLLTAGERVVSLSPAVTELVVFAGGRSALCGRSSACGGIAGAGELPVAGDLGKAFVEAVLRLRATLVISDCSHPQAQWQMLRRCGVKVELLNNRTLDDLPGNLLTVGKLLGSPAAGVQAAELEKKIRQLKTSIPEPRKRAIILFWGSPLISCGKDTFVDHALSLAGVENAAAAAGSGYFIITPEFLISAKPELLIFIGVPSAQADELLRQEVFRQQRSCRKIFLDSSRWSRLTPGLPEAVAALRAEIFAE